MIIREIIEPLTLKCGAFFERSGSKLRSKARSAELRRGSNPLRRAKKGHPIRDGPFWHISAEVRDSNHVRTCRGHVHEPVRTLANSLIVFPRPPQAERQCAQVSSLAAKKQSLHREWLLFFEEYGFPRQCCGTGSE